MSTSTQFRRDYSHVRPPDMGDLSADDFREIVNIDLKSSSSSPDRWISPAVSEALRSPAFRQRWLATLTSILVAVDTQLSSRQADHFRQEAILGKQLLDAGNNEDTLRRRLADERAGFWTHRAKTLRFRLVVLNAIHEAQHCCGLDSDGNEVARHERDVARERVQLLEYGIRLHRDLVLADLTPEEVPDEIDETLWGLLPPDKP